MTLANAIAKMVPPSKPRPSIWRNGVEPPGFFQPKHLTEVELPRTRLSDRHFAGRADPERLWSHKWRGVRTAPKGVGP